MKRICLLLVALVCMVITSPYTLAGNAYFSLNLEFNDPSDFSSGGTWTAVAKVDDYGLAGASLYLSDANFGAFLAPTQYAVQLEDDFGGIVLNVVVGDDGAGPPLLGVGVIGSSWPSTYVDDPSLVPFGGHSDLGSFTGGVALATGTFDPTVVPDWSVGLPAPNDETDANLYTSSGFPVVDAVTHLTVRNTVAQTADINGDGSVNAADAGIMFANWGVEGLTFAEGNINGDNYINAADAGILFANWSGIPGSSVTAIPEPAGLVLVLLGLCGVLAMPSIRTARTR